MKWKREKEKIKELSFTTCQKLHLGNSLSFKVVKENRTFLLEEASLCERKVLPATAGGQRKRNFQFVGGDLKSIVLLLLLLLGRQIGRWRSGPKNNFVAVFSFGGKRSSFSFVFFWGGSLIGRFHPSLLSASVDWTKEKRISSSLDLGGEEGQIRDLSPKIPSTPSILFLLLPSTKWRKRATTLKQV